MLTCLRPAFVCELSEIAGQACLAAQTEPVTFVRVCGQESVLAVACFLTRIKLGPFD